jgi:transposase
MEQGIIFVGLDVHKDTIVVALADSGRRGEVRQHGKIANTPANLKGLAGKLSRSGRELRFCYEAGPCGYGIQRQSDRCGP